MSFQYISDCFHSANQILDYSNDILLMTAKWYSASLKARPIFNICPRFGRQPNISLELDPDIGSYLLWSQPGVCYLLLAVCFLLMNYSTALHPIKNFSKALLGLINEEPGVIENLGFFCSIRQTPLPQNGPFYLAASL